MPSPGTEEGYFRLPAVEGAVEGGQVCDLQSHDDHPGGGGDDVDGGRLVAVRVDEPEREHRAPRLPKGGREVIDGGQKEQGVSDFVSQQPGRQLGEDNDRALSGQQLVLALVGRQRSGRHPEEEGDPLVDSVEHHRPASPGDDQGPHDVHGDGEGEQYPGHHCQRVQDIHDPKFVAPAARTCVVVGSLGLNPCRAPLLTAGAGPIPRPGRGRVQPRSGSAEVGFSRGRVQPRSGSAEVGFSRGRVQTVSWPLMQVTVPPPTQIVPSSSWSM